MRASEQEDIEGGNDQTNNTGTFLTLKSVVSKEFTPKIKNKSKSISMHLNLKYQYRRDKENNPQNIMKEMVKSQGTCW